MDRSPNLRFVVAFAAWLAVASMGHGQVNPGLRLLQPFSTNSAYLVDTNGAKVQTWTFGFLSAGGARLDADGTLLRAITLPNPPPAVGACGGVQRLALDSSVLWDYRYAVSGPGGHWTHHDIEVMPNGHVLLIAWDIRSTAQAIALGRSPSLIQGTTIVRVDHVIEVVPTGPTTGNIVWEWHVLDHLIQEADATKPNFGVVAQHPELIDFNYPPIAFQASDINHMNSVDYDPVHDWVILSAHNQNEVWVIDHGTTTAEAAGHTGGARGHGGDLLYRWGNPAAYQAGTSADQQLFGQHSANVIKPGMPGEGNVILFNNNPPGGSAATEFVLPLDAAGNFVPGPGPAWGPAAPVWQYASPTLHSSSMSSAHRLPNGNTLVCSALQNLTFEVTPGGVVVWSYTDVVRLFQDHYIDRALWADKAALSSSGGGTVSFDLIAGSAQAGLAYFLLASASGTSPGITANGFVLPLNFDDVLLLTIDNANTPLLMQTMGTLSPLGRATASLNLPPGVYSPVSGNFAFAAYDLATLTVTATSNAVPLAIGP